MCRRIFLRFLSDEEASTTVEFITIVPFFFVITFMVIEVALAVFWWQTAEKAAQIGARFAVVSDEAVTSLPATNALNIGHYGQSCDMSLGTNDPCQSFATATCVGGASTLCNSTAFNAIVTKVKSVFSPAQPSNVTVSYQYVGMGFAGGPIVPAVTVTISNVPFGTGFADLLGNIFGTTGLSTVSAMSATMTGEDLSSSGA